MKKYKKLSKKSTIIAAILGVFVVVGLTYSLSQTKIWESLFASTPTIAKYKVIRLEDEGLKSARVNDVSGNINGVAGYLFDDANQLQYAVLWNKQGKIVSKLRATDGGDMTYYKITDKVYRGYAEKKYGVYPNSIGYVYSYIDGSYPGSLFALISGKTTRFNQNTNDVKIAIKDKVLDSKSTETLKNLIKAYPILKNYPEYTQQLFLKPFIARNSSVVSVENTFEAREINNRNHILGTNYLPSGWKTSVWVNGKVRQIANAKVSDLTPKGADFVVGLGITNTNIIGGVVFNSKLGIANDLGFTYQYSTDPSVPTKIKVWKPAFLFTNEPGSWSMITNINDEGKGVMIEAFSERNAYFSGLTLIDAKNDVIKPLSISKIIVNRTGKSVALNGSVGINNRGDVLGAVIQGDGSGNYVLRYYIYNYVENSLRFIDDMIEKGTIIGGKEWDYIEPRNIADDGTIGAFCLKGDIFNPESDLAGCILVPSKY